ncbi:MAG: aminodeoxychorismate synthase component I [Anaerolineae bacterium]|nr:MAG: aminodeoxychorismate synthase component I [Anaerolineae bacterium]
MPSPLIILHDATQKAWLKFCDPHEILWSTQPEEVIDHLLYLEQKVAKEKLYAVGFLSYESAPAFDSAFSTPNQTDDFPLLWFGLFKEAQTINLSSCRASNFELSPWQPTVLDQQYAKAIQEIKAAIAQGDTYQVNYTIRLRARFTGDPFGYFRRLVAAQKAKYAAYLNLGDFVICSASPELFFLYQQGHLVCRPMKGTAKRGLTHEEDQNQADQLVRSVKNRAENVMIVDMIRNDLGRIAKVGSVNVTRLFEIEKYPTVWQMTSTIEAYTEANFAEIFKALFPCASITGAPKVSTMKIIAHLESSPRRIYTGSIGFLTPENRAQFNVAIRTVWIDRRMNIAEVGVGGGIVWDSTVEGEYHECLTKAQFLTHPAPDFALLETIRWTRQEGYFLLPEHLERLQKSAAYFDYPCDLPKIKKALLEYAQSFIDSQKVRLTLKADGTFAIQSQPLPDSRGLVQLVPAKAPLSSQNIYLYHKTTFREHYEKAKPEYLNRESDCEVLFWNEHGEVTESEIANIVVKIDGKLITPPVSCGLLAGVFRQKLLEQQIIHEEKILLSDLIKCQEIYLINSVRKWRQAKIHTFPHR